MFFKITFSISLSLTNLGDFITKKLYSIDIFIVFLFLVVIYIPLLRNKILKSTLILNILLHILIFIFIFVDSIYITVLITFFNYFYALVAFDTWRKVKSGKYVVYEKLDYSKLSSSDIKAELASRGRVLVHPADELKHN